ncbi:MAG: peptidylprolyl isomerase [Deltaproteobacteria bacterium]|nr:peptidylprolyl isomerase [Deltaproteobacteria bacterium]
MTDPEIDARLAAVTADYPEGEFEKTMKESGRSHAALRAQAAYLILVDKLIERVIDPSVAVHPSEIEAEYQLGIDRFKEAEKVRASQILVDTETEAEGIVMQLYSGADFAELARTRSKAPEARKGGDLGFFAEDEMPEVIADAAFSMAVGQTSGVLKSPFGYHILRVTDRRAEHFVPVESVRGQLEKEVRRKKAQAMFTSYLEKLRAASDVRYNQDLIMSMELP